MGGGGGVGRVEEREGWGGVWPFLANGVTDQGLGEVSVANEAGNPVLCEVQPSPCLPGWQAWGLRSHL